MFQTNTRFDIYTNPENSLGDVVANAHVLAFSVSLKYSRVRHTQNPKSLFSVYFLTLLIEPYEYEAVGFGLFLLTKTS